MIVGNVALVHRGRAAQLLERQFVPQGYQTGWCPIVREPSPGAWQRNEEIRLDSPYSYGPVYACITLIASDIAKLRLKLVELDEATRIWSEVTRPSPFAAVLRKPNHFENRIQFLESWIVSKLTRGNTYVLKEREPGRGVVRALYVLDPSRVQPLVAPDGSVYYKLDEDLLAGLSASDVIEAIPASEIIHDRMPFRFHPLVGIPPLWAAAIAANIGLKIERGQVNFFGKASTPSGLLTAPGKIDQDEAERMSARWAANYSGDNAGKVAVLGNGLTFEKLSMTAVDAQLIEQLRWTDERTAQCFHVPAFKIGAGTMPTYSNGEILDGRYYSDCLQSLIEHIELCLDEGLGLVDADSRNLLGVELDLDGLLRMDTQTQVNTLVTASGGAIMKPDEARKRIDLPPVPGGDTLYKQQQDYSLGALADRDADKPFAKPAEPVPAVPAVTADNDEERAAAIHIQARTRTLRLKLVA